MNAGLLLHAVAAAGLAGAGLASGAVFAFMASPLAALLALQAWAMWRSPRTQAPRRSIGLGVLTLLLGVAFGAFGHGVACAVALVAGAAVALQATRLSLSASGAPRGRAVPAAGAPALHLGLALDEAARLLLELRSLARSWPEFSGVAADARIAADRNQEEGWLSHPERAHEPPPPLEKLRLSRGRLRGVGELEELSFASEYQPQDPEIRHTFLATRRARTARAALLRQRGGGRPALVFVHGASRTELALGARALRLGALTRDLGVDLVLYTPPPVGPRGAARGLIFGEPLWTNAAVGQAIWELRRLTGFLRSEGASSIGVLGLSFGGYVASAFASVQGGVACVVAMNAPASLDGCFWRLLPPTQRAEARAAGLTRHLLEHAWARHAPLRMRPRVPHEARLVIGGLADRIVPPGDVEATWEHWGQPPVHWHPGTHLLWRETDAIQVRLRTHLGDHLV